MSSSDSNGRVFWTTAAAIICLDVATKLLAVKTLDVHIPRRVVGDIVRLTLAFNPGAAFSMSLGEYSRYIFGAFAVIALFILWRLFRTTGSGDTPRVLALGLAWGGAAGNLIDRFRSPYRGVVDFIDIGVGDVRFWTFNVADSAVTIGALLLAWVLWKEDRAASSAAGAAASDGSAPEGGEARSSS